jgi:hypothetical protein
MFLALSSKGCCEIDFYVYCAEFVVIFKNRPFVLIGSGGAPF